MARRRKMTPERRAFINGLLEHYQPTDAQDVQEMLKDLLGDALVISFPFVYSWSSFTQGKIPSCLFQAWQFICSSQNGCVHRQHYLAGGSPEFVCSITSHLLGY